MPTLGQRTLAELGLVSVIQSPFDVKLLCLQRFVRMFAFGAAALILALYLEELGYSDRLTGLFMTLTLLGDVLISLALTLFADKIGRKNVLVIGAGLVTVSGAVFATASNYWVLLAAAIFGVISPSGQEIGPFRAIEESILSSMAPTDIANSKSDLFAWYTLIGTLGAATGALTSGGIVHVLQHDHGYTIIASYRSLFWLYAILGIVKLAFAACLSKRIEVNKIDSKAKGTSSEGDDERRPLLEGQREQINEANTHGSTSTISRVRDRTPDGAPLATDTAPDSNETAPPPKGNIFPQVSADSRRHLYKLLPLFCLDSFASGLVPLSWLSPFFHDKYHLSHSSLGTLFFSTNLIGAASNIVSASIVRRAGLVYTMVLSHLPSSVFLAAIPFPPPSATWAAVLLLALRSLTATMDTAPRQAFLATLLDPKERTAVMGFTNVCRTVFQSAGPYVSGVLKAESLLWVSFVLAGGLKVVYDLGVLVAFWSWRNVVEGEKPVVEAGEGDGTDEEARTGGKARDAKDGGPIQMVDEEVGNSGGPSRRSSA